MPHNDDEHVQVTIGSSKTTLIRGKESGRLLTENNNNTVSNGGTEFLTTKDITTNSLLSEILLELRLIRQHLEVVTDEEIKNAN
jgi:hypothetical protein